MTKSGTLAAPTPRRLRESKSNQSTRNVRRRSQRDELAGLKADTYGYQLLGRPEKKFHISPI